MKSRVEITGVELDKYHENSVAYGIIELEDLALYIDTR
jgi:hypothetical protein